MAIKNLRSEKENMLAMVKSKLKAGEKKLNMLMQVVGSKEDNGMTRVYSAFLHPVNESIRK